jgi:magnesium transporter
LASVNDNRDMRKISAAVAILAVPTTLGAVYGMNFDNIPELHWQYGYFA